MIEKPNLNSKDTGGAVGQPEYATGQDIIATKSADMTNSGTDLNGSASSENRSAQFKNPRVSQDIPEKGRNQYENNEGDFVGPKY